MASAIVESIADDSCHEMQMTKESDRDRSEAASSTTDNSHPAQTAATAIASAERYGEEDDATMQTPLASSAQSFDAAGDQTAENATTGTTSSDFGSGSPTTGNRSETGSLNTSNSSSGSATEPDQNATIPQWKKELIQRRKANIARTIEANQLKGTTNSSSATPTMAAGTTKGSSISPTSPVLSIAKAFCNDSISPMTTPTTTCTMRTGHSSYGANNSPSGRAATPDIIQHDASSSGGHYPASGFQQQQQPEQLLSSCVDTSSSKSSASSLISAKQQPKTTSGTGFDTTQCATTDGVAATTTRSGGTCLTTSPRNDDDSPNRPTFSNHRQSSQLHSRLDVERAAVGDDSLSLQQSLLSSSQPPHSEQCNSIATGTLSSSFIKNPHVNKSSNKFSKYKSSTSSCSKSSSNGIGAATASVNSATSSATTVISNANSVNSSQSASVTSASCASGSSRKMVAAQELSDGGDTFDDFDPTEELQYGPGIVSKLRCRYLSLALRQTAAKQRPALDNLRRATGLNNLLDDDDRGSNSSCTTVTDHTSSSTHGPGRPHSENLGKSPDEFVSTFQKNPNKQLSTDKPRSWHTKRGADSLKRARSVEALLVYGDKAWENNDGTTITSNGVPVQMRYSYMQPVECTKNDISTIGSSTDVTIEDKIVNARERHSLSERPPRKISPFMDETERPPPDVVKQTLKIFEATANRRGRGLSRNNCNGEVANKVRNYKSIISQEKPPIIYPKPPLSPKKNFRKPGTPPGSLDIVAARTTVVSTIKSTLTGVSPTANNIPKKFANTTSAEVVESQSVTASNASSTAEPKSSPTPVPSVRTTLPFRLNSKNESTPIRSTDGSHSPNTPDIIPRKVFDSGPNFGGAVDSPVSHLTKQIERLKIESPAPQSGGPVSSPSVGAISPIAKLPPRAKLDSESDEVEEEDDDDDLDGESLSKCISKSALDNISKAGTTQQFNFSGSNANKSASGIGNNKPQVTTAATVNGSSNSGTTASSQPTASAISAKQIGVIRPLVAEPKQPPATATDNNKLKLSSAANASPAAADYTSHTDELITAKARDNLVISNLSQQQQQQLQQQQLQSQTNSIFNTLKATSNSLSSTTSNTYNKSIDFDDEPVVPATVVLQPQQQQQQPPPPARPTLTSREIEKNLINTKKIEEANLLEATNNGGSTDESSGAKWQFAKKKPRSGGAAQQQQQTTQNTMIFNFKDRKEVPDYIENDGLLFRRKRELPKPNESGFVLLGDLSLETSTDPDDEWTMGPPSPCDVEFENANVIIDGKSSIRCKSRDVSLRVQFDDTLTSTFEYPSESSFFDDTPIDNANNGSDNKIMGHIITASATTTASTAAIGSVTNAAAAATISTNTTDEITKNPGQKLLGSMSLGSAPLGSYIPMKAQINTNFELGVTRNPDTDLLSDDLRKNGSNTTKKTATTNGNSSDSETISKTNGVDYILNGSSTCNNDEPESLQYLKPASDDLTVAYSEGTQKTDLLY